VGGAGASSGAIGSGDGGASVTGGGTGTAGAGAGKEASSSGGGGGAGGAPDAPGGGPPADAGTSGSGAGGSGAGGSGAGGSGGTGALGTSGAGPDCGTPTEVTLKVDFDTTIMAAEPRTSFASDGALSIAPAPDERRILLQLALPATSPGSSVERATLELNLESNADALKRARTLGLHRLTREVGPATTWRNYSNKKWDLEGGDFGPELARAKLPASSSEGTLSFDVTELVQSSVSTTAVTLSMVILEIEPAPAAPAELAFTSLEGDASKAPALLLSLCQP